MRRIIILKNRLLLVPIALTVALCISLVLSTRDVPAFPVSGTLEARVGKEKIPGRSFVEVLRRACSTEFSHHEIFFSFIGCSV